MNRMNPVIIISCFLLSSCAGHVQSLRHAGKEPQMSKIELFSDSVNYKNDMIAMEERKNTRIKRTNSLWQEEDTNISVKHNIWHVGDIVKVKVVIQDSAKLNNSTNQTRSSSDKSGISMAFGVDIAKTMKTPDATSNFVGGAAGSHKYNGSGDVTRNEQINTEIAAIVTQVLPNGNLVIEGKQEVRVNNEIREVKLAGIISSRDISADNTVRSEQIAEARISYGGRGMVSDMQRPRVGTQVLDIIAPF